MIKEYRPLVQALLGTFFTWALTAAGALMVIFFKGTQPKLLDTSLGFAAGVMTAASYWSLLAPAIEMAKESDTYGADGRLAFIPACVGFLLGAAFTFAADILISKMGIESPTLLLAIYDKNNKKTDYFHRHRSESSIFIEPISEVTDSVEDGNMGTTITRRRPHTTNRHPKPAIPSHDARLQWKRILLLIIAITVHNIPEGLAVGVGFGAIGSSNSATFHNARNLAIGIGIQNFPEGLAVSLPLKAAGFSTLASFWYGQLSGMVEPLFGLIGVLLVTAAQPVLPYALAFAAGAMIYVVVDDIIPEANTKGNGSLASWGAIFGFMVMMVLEVGLQ
uniref:Zinc transporter ZIP11 n=1 Tax=Panstrongylus lignarius TaxID=156445 RepID=A0A224XFK4_9HEMI